MSRLPNHPTNPDVLFTSCPFSACRVQALYGIAASKERLLRGPKRSLFVERARKTPRPQRCNICFSVALSPLLAHGFAGSFRFLRFMDRRASVTFQLRLDVVVYPLLVPPLDRQDRDPVQVNAEVEMVAGRESRLARLAQNLPLLDRLTVLDVDGAQMAIEREKPEAVIQDHGIAVDAQVAGEGHRAAVGGFHGIMPGDGQVVA